MECGGKRWQAKRDAALASVCVASISKPASQAKAASRFACRRTPYGFDRHFESHPGYNSVTITNSFKPTTLQPLLDIW